MPLKYKCVDTTTLAGIKQAERLHMNGWKIIRTGVYSLMFEKKVEKKAPKKKTKRGGLRQ